VSQVQTRYHFDTEGFMVIDRVQDVEPVLEANKEMRAQDQRSEWYRYIGEIPNVLIEKWIVEDGLPLSACQGEEFNLLIKRKLRDPDYAFLRTTDKRF
jgi:hypothetical protein